MSLVYNWLWNCKCLIAYTFRGSLLGFCFSLLLLSLLTNKNSHWAFEFEFDWNAEKAARAQQQNDHTKKWVIFFPKKNAFFSLLENHSNWILPLFAHLTLCFFLQLQWNVYPICQLPAALRGKPISDLNATVLVECMDIDSNDLYDIAGISENILLMQGNGFW